MQPHSNFLLLTSQLVLAGPGGQCNREHALALEFVIIFREWRKMAIFWFLIVHWTHFCPGHMYACMTFITFFSQDTLRAGAPYFPSVHNQRLLSCFAAVWSWVKVEWMGEEMNAWMVSICSGENCRGEFSFKRHREGLSFTETTRMGFCSVLWSAQNFLHPWHCSSLQHPPCFLATDAVALAQAYNVSYLLQQDLIKAGGNEESGMELRGIILEDTDFYY